MTLAMFKTKQTKCDRCDCLLMPTLMTSEIKQWLNGAFQLEIKFLLIKRKLFIENTS